MKKALSLILALALCLGLAAPALALDYGEEWQGHTNETAQQYKDVAPSHWAYNSINTCSERKWFNGYPDGTFLPSKEITREEAAKVFAVAMGLTIEENPTITYTDTANNWARAYMGNLTTAAVIAAASGGIPGKPLPRGDMRIGPARRQATTKGMGPATAMKMGVSASRERQ